MTRTSETANNAKEGASRPHRDLLTVSAPMRRVSGNVSGGVTGIPRASALTG
jgi:hypothetical protein